MENKVTSFVLRVLLMAVFYFLAYEYWLDKSLEDTTHIIITSTIAVLLIRAWEFFKKRRSVSNSTQKRRSKSR